MTRRDAELMRELKTQVDWHERQRALVLASLLRRNDATGKRPAVKR
jgi:hypothetical protein